VHAAKGLEFSYVFLCSLSEGVFPAKKTADREAMEEERRLAFVALTRAQRGLYLSESEGKTLSGVFRFPSRFILDIDKPLLHYVNPPPEDLIKAARRQIDNEDEVLRPAAALEFKTGDQVLHQVLGPGTILNVDERKKAYEIKFEMLPTSRIISFRVKLERR
jgi:DNA helicase-2/ATP-dependent DNA helicase PcrA